ncbi:MAG: hypothetical protein HOO88_02035 [Kiritimatiellaceae bacterium]|nr:hypothetical protein [Kiritimatiellaceae bacterium]
MDIPETAERFVAFFDIMGFKDLVYRNDHKEVQKIMARVCKTVASLEKFRGDVLKNIAPPIMFSDSIIFVSHGNTPEDADDLLLTATYLLCEMLVARVPIKGALAYGLFTADFEKSSFFGRPLVDACLLAEEMHFYGAILHHSVEPHLPPHKEKSDNIALTLRAPVPMKGGPVTHSYADWRHFMKDGQTQESVLEPFYSTVSGSTRRYVDNTIGVYTPVKK